MVSNSRPGARESREAMSHFLIAPLPFSNHVFEHLTIAHALVKQGHRVTIYADAWVRPHARTYGCTFVETETVDLLGAIRGARSTTAVTRVLQAHADQVAMHLSAWLNKHPVDACLVDSTSLGLALAAERGGMPWASLAITPAEHANHFRKNSAQARLRATPIRKRLGLPSTSKSAYEQAASPFLNFMPWVPDFDMGRQPAHAVHLGTLALPTGVTAAPKWLSTLDESRPTVLVTMTTMPFDALTEWMEYFGAVAVSVVDELKIQAVISTGAFADRLPRARSRAVRYVPSVSHAQIMPRLTAVVTHGGWGTIGRALRFGVPQVNVPMIMDQPLNSQRAAKLGVGLNLPIARLTPQKLADALTRVLAPQNTYRATSLQYARHMPAYGGADEGARLLTQLAAGSLRLTSQGDVRRRPAAATAQRYRTRT